MPGMRNICGDIIRQNKERYKEDFQKGIKRRLYCAPSATEELKKRNDSIERCNVTWAV